MARVPYLQPSDVPEEYRDLLSGDSNLLRALINSPNAARDSRPLPNFIRFKSRLDPRLRELAILQVGYLARSPYEWVHHIEIGHQFGVSDDDIRAMIDDTNGKPNTLDAQTKTVLKAAREITEEGAVSDATFTALKQFLDNERYVDLVIATSHYNSVVRILGSLQIEPEDGYQRYLDQFPLPSGPRR